MISSRAMPDRPAARRGRRAPLLVGLVIIAVVMGGYLGLQHFTYAPSATMPEVPPAVPVIATTVQQRNFPIVLAGIGNVTALNSATVRSMVTEQILSIDFKDGEFVKKASSCLSSIRARIRRSLTKLKPILPAIRPISKTGASISADRFRCRNKALHRNNKSPPSKR